MVSFVKDIKEVVKRIVRNGQKRKKKGGRVGGGRDQ